MNATTRVENENRVNTKALVLLSWRFCAWWTLALIAVFLLFEFTVRIVYTYTGSDVRMAQVIAFVVLLFSYGLAQGSVLNRAFANFRLALWVMVSAAAQLLCWLLVNLAYQKLVEPDLRQVLTMDQFAPVAGAIIGLGLGLSQSVILRAYIGKAPAMLWVAANLMAWAICG